jgi:hypothetical protein
MNSSPDTKKTKESCNKIPIISLKLHQRILVWQILQPSYRSIPAQKTL